MKALLAEPLNGLISSSNLKNEIIIDKYIKRKIYNIDYSYLIELPSKFETQISLPRNVDTDATKTFRTD